MVEFAQKLAQAGLISSQLSEAPVNSTSSEDLTLQNLVNDHIVLSKIFQYALNSKDRYTIDLATILTKLHGPISISLLQRVFCIFSLAMAFKSS